MPRKNPKKDLINRSDKQQHDDMIHPQRPKDVIEKKFKDFVDGINTLKERIANGETDEALARTRERLGDQAWSFEHLYGYDLTKYKLKTLGIVPNRGTHIGRGQR